MPTDQRDEMMTAGAVCVLEMSDAIVNAIGEHLKTHGPDPNAPAIASSALLAAMQRMDKVDPRISEVVWMGLNRARGLTP